MDERFWRMIKAVAPGTDLREGLENILRARTGALIVVGDGPQVLNLVDGGFRIDVEATPARLYEVAKMDGALILSHDARRILVANAHLAPDAAINSGETGIRHLTADRVSKQTGELVIAISQRRNLISLYMGQIRYVLRDPAVILAKANQALQTLDKYRTVLKQTFSRLSMLEMEDQVTVADVCLALQRTDMVIRVTNEIERYAAELGTEGHLVNMQLAELTEGVAAEAVFVLRDYRHSGPDLPAPIQAILGIADEVPEPAHFSRMLGYGSTAVAMEAAVTPRGFRMLSRIPRLREQVIENLVSAFGSLPAILRAGMEELDEVEGIGEVRAKAIREGLRRLREQLFRERYA